MAKNNKSNTYTGFSGIFSQRRKYDFSDYILNSMIYGIGYYRPKYIIIDDIADCEQVNIEEIERNYIHLKNIHDAGFPDREVDRWINLYGKEVFENGFDYYLGLINKTKQDYSNMFIKITHTNGYLMLETDWNRAFLTQLKRDIPSWKRRWCPVTKKWFLTSDSLQILMNLIHYHNIKHQITGDKSFLNAIQEKEFTIEYINKNTNFMKYNGSLHFRRSEIYRAYTFQRELFWLEREAVEKYFRSTPQTDNAKDYYALLGLRKHANEELIKSQFRKMMLTHHPDRGGDHEVFIKIKDAFDILKDPQKKRKYDASLAIMAQTQQQEAYQPFKLEKTCGRITAKGSFWLGIFVVSEVLDWQDIIKEGKKMHSIYNSETNNYEIFYR